MIIGTAGSRKSTAIKYSARLLSEAGYEHLAATSTTREQFFEDFSSQLPEDLYEGYRMGLLNKVELETNICEYTVVADEFNDFAGLNNIPMYTSLSNLWDFRGPFEYRPKHGKKVIILNPVLNMLSGNTADGFAAAFPASTINQGLPSRTILINSLGRRRKIFWPEAQEIETRQRLITQLQALTSLAGPCTVSPGAKVVLKDIYDNWIPIPDSRFSTYGSRRYQQLLKLCIICAASYTTLVITREIVIEANSILTFAERYMPDALGEHGLNRSSPAVARILDTVKYCPDGVIKIEEIYKSVASDVKDYRECQDILMNLVQAGKVQATKAGITYIHRNAQASPNEKLHCKLATLWENEIILQGS